MQRSASMSALVGRNAECQVLDALVRTVRDGGSDVRVLLGQAGVGKTTLLGHLRASAADLHILDATGIESEMELPYAGLHQVCAPILHLRAAVESIEVVGERFQRLRAVLHLEQRRHGRHIDGVLAERVDLEPEPFELGGAAD